jgi:HlyD family secretion protein
VQLDHAMIDVQLQQAEAGIALAQAQRALIQNGARSEDIAQAEEAKHAAEISYNNAKEDYERVQQLFATHTVTQKQFDDAKARFLITEAQYNSARQNFEKIKRISRPEELNAAQARVLQAETQAQLLQMQITDATITAPVEGMITHRPVEIGELIGAGAIVATIARVQKLELMIYVSETELANVRVGGSAEVMIDAFPERKFLGTVIYISPSAEFTPKNVQTKEDRTKLVFGVKLEVENPGGELKAGMPADALIK